MATVIDHVVLELGIDPKKFDEGIKKSAEAWLKMRQQAEDSRKHTEEPIDGMTKAFGAVTTKVLAFAASLVTLQKLVQFGANLVKGNISLRNLSATTQISTETLSKWIGAAERSGSSMESMTQAIAGMDRELKDIQVGGGGDNLLALVTGLNQAGADIKNPDKTTTATEMWLRIIEGMDKIGMSASRRTAFLQKLGYADPSIIALTLKGADSLKKLIAEQEGIYVVTGKNIEESERLNKLWYELEQRAKSLGQVLLHDLFGPISAALTAASIGTTAVEQRVTPPKSSDALGPDSGRSGKGGMLQPFLFPFFGGGKKKEDQSGDEPAIPPNARPNSFQRSSLPTEGGQTYRGAASYYSGLPSEGGAMTSTGERVNPESYTGALQTDLAKQYGGLRKGGVWGDVVDEKTGKRVRVYFNDTGPLRPGRIVDLAPKAFKEFGPLSKGVAPNLRLEMLPTPPKGQKYIGGPVQEGSAGGVFDKGAPPLSWLSNPRLLRASRFNQMTNPTNNYATSEATVHSLIVNSAEKPVTDDAYGLSTDAIPALDRGGYMSQMTEGPF